MMRKTALTANQVRGFWAAWGGWALDGMDSFIYALVMVPALRELLPRSGIAANADSLGFHGGLLFALFTIAIAVARHSRKTQSNHELAQCPEGAQSRTKTTRSVISAHESGLRPTR